jgi:hypothetical protein
MASSRRESGKWLEPYDFAEPGRFWWFSFRDVPLLDRASAGQPTGVDTPVGGDPVEPSAERGAPLEPSEALPCSEQCLLEGVLGILEGSEHLVAVHLELRPVRAVRVAVIYGAGGAIGGRSHAPLPQPEPRSISPDTPWHLWTLSPKTSLPSADPPRRRRSTPSTRWTGIRSS